VIPVGQRPLEDLAVEGVLGREVVKKAGPADADSGGDVVERRPLVSVLGEAAQRLGQDGVPGGEERMRGDRPVQCPVGQGRSPER